MLYKTVIHPYSKAFCGIREVDIDEREYTLKHIKEEAPFEYRFMVTKVTPPHPVVGHTVYIWLAPAEDAPVFEQEQRPSIASKRASLSRRFGKLS